MEQENITDLTEKNRDTLIINGERHFQRNKTLNKDGRRNRRGSK